MTSKPQIDTLAMICFPHLIVVFVDNDSCTAIRLLPFESQPCLCWEKDESCDKESCRAQGGRLQADFALGGHVVGMM